MRSLLLLATSACLLAQDISTLHGTLGQNLTQWQSQGAGVSDAILLQRVGALGTGFNGFVPLLGGFRPGDYQTNRELVRRSLAWLALIEPRGYANPALGRSIANAYGTLGAFGSRPECRPYGYGYGAAYGYAGAGRLSRRLWLGGYGDDYERDFERYALQLGTFGALWGGGFMPGRFQRRPEGLDAVDFGPPPDTGRKPLPLPAVDTAKLTPAQKEEWDEVRPQFTATATRVFDALQSLDGLAARLQRQGMQVNSTDRANATLMEGFLQDAADLIKASDFAGAKKALDKAGYVRARLKSVVGG